MNALEFIAAWFRRAWDTFLQGTQSALSEQAHVHSREDPESATDWRTNKKARDRRDFPFTDPSMRGHVGNIFHD